MSEYRLLNERFIFTGPVPDEDLAAYYRHAAVYISLSEHEGFCAPLLEAMAADVPMLAYAAAAVPETLGGAGVQFAPKDLEYAAELAGALAFDDDLRSRVIAGQRRRLADFGDERMLSGSSGADRPSITAAPLRTRTGAATLPANGSRVGMKIALRSSNAMAPRCSADRSSSAGWLPSGWPACMKSTCLPPAPATTSPGRTTTPKATDRIRGVTVRRFANAGTRDLDSFNRYSDWILQQPAHAAPTRWSGSSSRGPGVPT